MSDEKAEQRPMTVTEAHALVAYAISICKGEPDWLACSVSPTGPIVVAIHGKKPTDADFVTDHIADAVNWLVAQDRITPEAAAAEWIQHLVRAGLDWTELTDNITLDEVPWELVEAGSKMAELIRIMAETFGVEPLPLDDPTGQEPLPLPPVKGG